MSRSVTVFIVTHQSKKYIDLCLSSLVLAAPKSRLVISVWDNASNDESVAKLESAGVTVIASAENIGFGAAVTLRALIQRNTSHTNSIGYLMIAEEEHTTLLVLLSLNF